MIVMPAVDLRGGRVVRLRQGLDEQATVYALDPAEAARRFEAAGAQRLHVVDLDAALTGRPQAAAVAALIAAVRVPVEVGGGVRTFDDAQRYRDVGAERVIFGTAAVTAPDQVQAAAAAWSEGVAVAIDARDGQVTVAGWLQDTGLTAAELAARVRAWGITRVQYTDVARDGTFAGPNLPAIEQLARACGLRMTAAGGIASLEDLRRLGALEDLGVDEVIVGKALYEGRFTLAEAQAAAQAHA